MITMSSSFHLWVPSKSCAFGQIGCLMHSSPTPGWCLWEILSCAWSRQHMCYPIWRWRWRWRCRRWWFPASNWLRRQSQRCWCWWQSPLLNPKSKPFTKILAKLSMMPKSMAKPIAKILMKALLMMPKYKLKPLAKMLAKALLKSPITKMLAKA